MQNLSLDVADDTGLHIDVTQGSIDFTVYVELYFYFYFFSTDSGTFKKGIFAINTKWHDLKLSDFEQTSM